MQLKARVKISWNPSVSGDVVAQNILVVVAGELILVNEVLPPTLDEFQVVLNENDAVYVELTCVDESGKVSDPAKLSFHIPDLRAPQPITGLGFEIIEVFEVEDEPEPEPPVEEVPQ